MGREALIGERQEALLGVVPYAAIRQFDAALVQQVFVAEKWLRFGDAPGQQIFTAGSATQPVQFLYTALEWDTQFFGFRASRLLAVLFGSEVEEAALATAVALFGEALRAAGMRHCYAEVAAKDPRLLYALGRSGWSVVETRLHFYRADLLNLPYPRCPVRLAGLEEAETIRQVSARNRNVFDRFHTDPVFTGAQGDSFLGEYAAAAVRGLCDVVLVPAVPTPLDSFLAVSYLTADAERLHTTLGRVVLTAVGPANRGWHRKLISETLWHTRERGGQAVLMTTQATNLAVVHNSMELGFALGGTTHICSKIF